MNYGSGISNWHTAKSLTVQGHTGIRWTVWDDVLPQPIPANIDIGDKIEGMMLGLAIGDSLGNTSESMIPAARRARYGWIEEYLPNRHAAGQRIGLPSDDTQLAFWTLERLNQDGRIDPHGLGIAFSNRQIFGIGKSVREFLGAFKTGVAWYQAGSKSAGNGALMRIAPILIPHLSSPGLELWGDVVLASHLTHRDGLSTAACVGFVALLWEAIGMDRPPVGTWWIDRFIKLTRAIEPEESYHSRGAPIEFNGRLTDLIEQHVLQSLDRNMEVDAACGQWYSGAYCLETVPSVLYILARHTHDPERAILEAVNNTKDNDTIAAIVGAAIGALYGKSGLRQSWIEQLSGRTGDGDDGQVFHLLEQGCRRFGFETSDQIRGLATPARKRIDRQETSSKAASVRGGTVRMQGRFWIKILGMLQQVWASIRTRKWQDKEGQERYTTEIEANEMQMLGGRPSVAHGESGEYDGGYETLQAKPQTQSFAPRSPTSMPGGAKKTTTAFHPDDDDIPFFNTDVLNDILGRRLERRMLKVRPILHGDDL